MNYCSSSDGAIDCSDQSDEHHCMHHCMPEHFQCENGNCIIMVQRFAPLFNKPTTTTI